MSSGSGNNSSGPSTSHSPDTSADLLDRVLWNFVGFSLLLLILLNFMRYPAFDTFVNLESNALELEFRSGNRFEYKLIEFDQGTTIASAEAGSLNLEGAIVDRISATSANSALRLVGISSDRIQLCLGRGVYKFATSRAASFRTLSLEIPGDTEYCLQLTLSGPLLIFPDVISIGSHRDTSRDVIIHPELSGSLLVRLTGKEIEFISGMSLRLAIDDDTETGREDAILLNYSEGRFGIHTWKRVELMLAEGGRLRTYGFSPLDALRKYMEENGLWYTLMLVVGAVFTLRKVLLLR